MRTTEDIDQKTIDERIHKFMARKSPLRTFSKTIADWLLAPFGTKSRKSGISYETTEWHNGRMIHSL